MHSPKIDSETRIKNRKRYIVKPILFLAAGMWLASVSAWADVPQKNGPQKNGLQTNGPQKNGPQTNGPKEVGPKVTGAAYLNWAEGQLPPLPDGSGQQSTALGVAGPFAGVHHDRLIVAGGANFPDGLPWIPIDATGKLPQKIYYDTVFVLSKQNGASPEWSVAKTHLPQPLAYGTSIPTPKGVLCIGGEWKTYAEDAGGKATSTTHPSDQIFLLAWDPQSESVRLKNRYAEAPEPAEDFYPFPPLPQATTMLGGTIVDNKIYVLGGATQTGATDKVWMLDLDRARVTKDAAGNVLPWRWQAGPPIPGPARILPVVAAQNDGTRNNVYLFSGRTPGNAEESVILTDAYALDPEQKSWKRLRDVGGDAPRSVMAGSGLASGKYNILVFGWRSRRCVFKKFFGSKRTSTPAGRQATRQAAASTLEELNRLRGSEHPRGFRAMCWRITP